MFGTWLAVAYAVPRQFADTVCANTTWRPNPTIFDTTVIAPISMAAWPMARPGRSAAPGSAAAACGRVTACWRAPPAAAQPVPPRAAGAGRRPSMSSQRSGGVRSITLVKLTTSLAAVSPMIPASSAIRAGRGRRAAAAVPSMAPSALAPASPSMARSPRSSPSSAERGARPAPRPAARPAGAAAASSPPPATRP